MKWAYFCVGNMLVSGLAILACTIAFHGRAYPVRAEVKITNNAPPELVRRIVGGDPLRSFGQSDLGLPADGYCEDRSNGVSWRVISCFGTQPEAQP